MSSSRLMRLAAYFSIGTGLYTIFVIIASIFIWLYSRWVSFHYQIGIVEALSFDIIEFLFVLVASYVSSEINYKIKAGLWSRLLIICLITFSLVILPNIFYYSFFSPLFKLNSRYQQIVVDYGNLNGFFVLHYLIIYIYTSVLGFLFFVFRRLYDLSTQQLESLLLISRDILTDLLKEEKKIEATERRLISEAGIQVDFSSIWQVIGEKIIRSLSLIFGRLDIALKRYSQISFIGPNVGDNRIYIIISRKPGKEDLEVLSAQPGVDCSNIEPKIALGVFYGRGSVFSNPLIEEDIRTLRESYKVEENIKSLIMFPLIASTDNPIEPYGIGGVFVIELSSVLPSGQKSILMKRLCYIPFLRWKTYVISLAFAQSPS